MAARFEPSTFLSSTWQIRPQDHGVLLLNEKMIMDKDLIRECIKTIKIKNKEGFDRIPQRVLVDGCENLFEPLAELFELIYKKYHNNGSLQKRYHFTKRV